MLPPTTTSPRVTLRPTGGSPTVSATTATAPPRTAAGAGIPAGHSARHGRMKKGSAAIAIFLSILMKLKCVTDWGRPSTPGGARGHRQGNQCRHRQRRQRPWVRQEMVTMALGAGRAARLISREGPTEGHAARPRTRRLSPRPHKEGQRRKPRAGHRTKREARGPRRMETRRNGRWGMSLTATRSGPRQRARPAWPRHPS